MRSTRSVAAAALLLGAVGCKNESEPYCRQAHAEINQAIAALRQSLGEAGGQAQSMPLEPFLSHCKRLSPEVAHCAVPSYNRDHEAECQQHRARLQTIRTRP